MSIKYPTNEQEAIYWFIKRSEELGYSIVSFWSIYPDATIIHNDTGREHKVEFEYKLSSFIKHGHDPRHCDLVVCWTNDLREVDFPITVWELRKENYPNIEIPEPSKVEKLRLYIKNKHERKHQYPSLKSEKGIFDGLFKK